MGEQIPLLLGLFLILLSFVAYLYVKDVSQQRHSVLRNFPVIGRLRYFFERIGEYFRQYFFLGDRDEMPFDRSTRAWVYRLSKNEAGVIGFGSTYDLHRAGALLFVNAAFPVLEEDCSATPAMVIGEGYCAKPFTARSVVNISAMSYGAISRPAVQALSRGAASAGCWLDTGEGGLSPYHLEGGCDLIVQMGTAKYGMRDQNGALSDERLIALAMHESVRAFEIKLSQGAKPGKGGVLPAAKVTQEIADIRGIPAGVDSISPNRHPDMADIDSLLDTVVRVRTITGKPVGIKTALGGRYFMQSLCAAVLARGLDHAPDFIVIDGGEGEVVLRRKRSLTTWRSQLMRPCLVRWIHSSKRVCAIASRWWLQANWLTPPELPGRWQRARIL